MEIVLNVYADKDWTNVQCIDNGSDRSKIRSWLTNHESEGKVSWVVQGANLKFYFENEQDATFFSLKFSN